MDMKALWASISKNTTFILFFLILILLLKYNFLDNYVKFQFYCVSKDARFIQLDKKIEYDIGTLKKILEHSNTKYKFKDNELYINIESINKEDLFYSISEEYFKEKKIDNSCDFLNNPQAGPSVF